MTDPQPDMPAEIWAEDIDYDISASHRYWFKTGGMVHYIRADLSKAAESRWRERADALAVLELLSAKLQECHSEAVAIVSYNADRDTAAAMQKCGKKIFNTLQYHGDLLRKIRSALELNAPSLK
jgi:hypothetical protein